MQMYSRTRWHTLWIMCSPSLPSKDFFAFPLPQILLYNEQSTFFCSATCQPLLKTCSAPGTIYREKGAQTCLQEAPSLVEETDTEASTSWCDHLIQELLLECSLWPRLVWVWGIQRRVRSSLPGLKEVPGTSVAAKWLRFCTFNTRGVCFIPGWETKIPYPIRCGQK